jgi:hypothetical protein
MVLLFIISELIVNCALLRWYAEDLERVPSLADLKNLPGTPLDLLVCSKIAGMSTLLTGLENRG